MLLATSTLGIFILKHKLPARELSLLYFFVFMQFSWRFDVLDRNYTRISGWSWWKSIWCRRSNLKNNPEVKRIPRTKIQVVLPKCWVSITIWIFDVSFLLILGLLCSGVSEFFGPTVLVNMSWLLILLKNWVDNPCFNASQ